MACRTSWINTAIAEMASAPRIPATDQPVAVATPKSSTRIHEIPPIHRTHETTTARKVVSDMEKALTKGKKSQSMEVSSILITTRMRMIDKIQVSYQPHTQLIFDQTWVFMLSLRKARNCLKTSLVKTNPWQGADLNRRPKAYESFPYDRFKRNHNGPQWFINDLI